MANYKLQILCVFLIASLSSVEMANTCQLGEVHTEAPCNVNNSVCTECCKKIFGQAYNVGVGCSVRIGRSNNACICNMCQDPNAKYKKCT
ncbi:hypothetical protein CASFOL_010081 [Castilleja foliolosa]|uniref:Uncharacterized protein n=1 Tax=Castilleja foliolosa TaxID=1961234 RepID=A0ABD3DRK7_9LAMI